MTLPDRRIDVATLPNVALSLNADCYVVIDAFRATTTIATLFAGGLRSLTACARIDDAYRLQRERGALLFGEVHGLPPEGFDHGNSPMEASRLDVAGRDGVLFTTNGTAALVGVAERGPVFAGAFVNAAVVARSVHGYRSVLLVCAGNARGTEFSLEDFAAAGAIVRAMVDLGGEIYVSDAARAAMQLPVEIARDSSHATTLRSLGLDADIDFALHLDAFAAAPRVVAHGDGWAQLEQ